MNTIAILVPDSLVDSIENINKRLTPSQEGTWKDAKFVVNPKEGEFDGIIVLQSVRPLNRIYNLKSPHTRVLLVLQEPPDILFLPEAYTRQFYCSLGQDKRVESKINLLMHSGHHWFVDIKISDAISNTSFTKTKLLSAIVSNKGYTPGHRKRLDLCMLLKNTLESNLIGMDAALMS